LNQRVGHQSQVSTAGKTQCAVVSNLKYPSPLSEVHQTKNVLFRPHFVELLIKCALNSDLVVNSYPPPGKVQAQPLALSMCGCLDVGCSSLWSDDCSIEQSLQAGCQTFAELLFQSVSIRLDVTLRVTHKIPCLCYQTGLVTGRKNSKIW